ncbi:MAG: hypothetical protein IJ646_09195 [Clostridia bacterium]|nr:hypothetical protein [Clostridia bacterium]
MATSSIYQNIYIKDRRKIGKFVQALEQSKETPAKEVAYSRPVEEVMDPDMIRKIFEDKQDDGL